MANSFHLQAKRQAPGERPHQRRGDFWGDKHSDCQRVHQDALHKDIQVIPAVGKAWKEGSVVLHRAHCPSIPPILKRRVHFGVHWPRDNTEPKRFPHIPEDKELLHQGEPGDAVLHGRSQGQNPQVHNQEDKDHAPMPAQDCIVYAKADIGIQDVGHSHICFQKQVLTFHQPLIWRKACSQSNCKYGRYVELCAHISPPGRCHAASKPWPPAQCQVVALTKQSSLGTLFDHLQNFLLEPCPSRSHAQGLWSQACVLGPLRPGRCSVCAMMLAPLCRVALALAAVEGLESYIS